MNGQLKFGVISDVKKGFAKVYFEENEIVSHWLHMLVRKSKSDKDSWPFEVNEHVACLMDDECNEGIILGSVYNDEDEPDTGEGEGKWRKKFSDGTWIEYDKNTKVLTADVNGDIEVVAKDATVTAANISAKATTLIKAEAGFIQAEAVTLIKAKAPTIDIEAALLTKINSTLVQITSPLVEISGALTAASITTTGAGGATINGNVNVDGKVTASGNVEGADMVSNGKSFNAHRHTETGTGGGITTVPI